MSITTDRTVHTSGPDVVVVVLDKTIKDACLIDVEISDSQNFHSTITEKFPKYTDLKED
jgi:hypothetical protein